MNNLLLQSWILHREHNLHALIKVARHPVGASHVHLRASAVLKVENAGMLQEVSDNGMHADVFT